MTIPLTTEGGKGSKPRESSNQKAYEDGWERIFGKKNLTKEVKEVIIDVQNKTKEETEE